MARWSRIAGEKHSIRSDSYCINPDLDDCVIKHVCKELICKELVNVLTIPREQGHCPGLIDTVPSPRAGL